MKSEARRARRRYLRQRALQLLLVFAVVTVMGRAAQLQVFEGNEWRNRAINQHEKRVPLPAPRGTIYDREGRELAVSRTTYNIAVAPHELRNTRSAAQVLRAALDVPQKTAQLIAESDRRWVVLPGRHSILVKEELEERVGVGVYYTPVIERFYPMGDLAGELLGRVNADGRGGSGLELFYDSLLTGQPGFAVRRRDATGASAGWLETPVVEPTPGVDIHLSIDSELQALAASILEDAIAESGANGGDLLIVEPQKGDLLAAASRRESRRDYLAAVTEPYEPGSTLKPFTAAALLQENLAKLNDNVDTGIGEYTVAGRTIHDTRPHGRLSLAEVLEVSSNVGMAKFAERLSQGIQYSYLRSFGFGTPTGLTYPSESSGLLRPPNRWSRQSRASLAIGYEVAVTPLQLAMAYAALANGGLLMRPRLVLGARVGDQASRWDTEPQIIRRVVSEEIASQLREVLAHAVTQGTG